LFCKAAFLDFSAQFFWLESRACAVVVGTLFSLEFCRDVGRQLVFALLCGLLVRCIFMRGCEFSSAARRVHDLRSLREVAIRAAL